VLVNEFLGLRVALVGPLPLAAGDAGREPTAGGMANQTRQLAELLRSDGAVVEPVQSNAPYRPVWVSDVPMLRALCRLLPFLLALWRAAGRNDVFHVMANSGWAWHLFAAPAIWIAWARRVPTLVNYRGGEAAAFLSRSSTWVRWTMERAHTLVVPSAFLQEVFRGHGMTARVVPNVVDLARFRTGPDGVRRAAHVVVPRHLEPIYDNATALRAFALVRRQRPDAELSIAGGGPDAARLRHLADELGVLDAVRFTGVLDRDAMAVLYRSATVCLNPSLIDNAPNALLEAMASGVPIVSTNVGGVPFLVEDGKSALLVAPQDPQAMASALLLVLSDEALRQRLVQTGLQQVQRHTWPQVGPLLAASYRRALVTATATAGA
jgi:glycosyltransferase involved in cell wall biosynthesis